MMSSFSPEELLQRLEQQGDQAPQELVQAILDRGQEMVPALCRVLESPEYWLSEDDQKVWMPVHAVKLLGLLADPQAIPALVGALTWAEETDDWILEDLPTVFGRLGPSAVEPLKEFINAHRRSDTWWPKATGAQGLVSIALQHPQERPHVVPFLHSLLTEEADETLRSWAAAYLLDLKDPSSFPILAEAFHKGLIDESVVSEDDLLEAQGQANPPGLWEYQRDLLEFYQPQEAAQRRKQWEQEAKEKARRLQAWQKTLEQELRRLQLLLQLPNLKAAVARGRHGRNDPCVCGSGKKYKKCCLPRLEALPPKHLVQYPGHRYADKEYLERAPAHDPMLALENLTELAFQAEARGEPAQAMQIYRAMEPLAARMGALETLLEGWHTLCANNPQLGEEGLAILLRHVAYWKDRDQEHWASARADVAEYLDELGRGEEAWQEYRALLAEAPDSLNVRLRFARFLLFKGQAQGAAQHYQQVLQKGPHGWVDEADLGDAAQELRALAEEHHLALDPQTLAALERWGTPEDAPEVPPG